MVLMIMYFFQIVHHSISLEKQLQYLSGQIFLIQHLIKCFLVKCGVQVDLMHHIINILLNIILHQRKYHFTLAIRAQNLYDHSV